MGIEPTAQEILAVKSTVHFLADFAPIAAEVIFVDSPGVNPCRLDRVTYRALRPGALLLYAEPSFHVGEKLFTFILAASGEAGFRREGEPKVRFSRSALLVRR